MARISLTRRALCIGTMAALATPARSQEISPDLAVLKRRGVLKVGMMERDDLPFFYTRDGNLLGTDVQLAKATGAALDLPVEFVRTAAETDDLITQVNEGVVDMALSKLVRTPQRLGYVLFSEPYLHLRQAFLLNRLRTARKLNGRSVEEFVRDFDDDLTFIETSSWSEFAKANFPRARLFPAPDWPSAIGRVTEGSVTAAYYDEFEIRRFLEASTGAMLSMRSVVFEDASLSYVVAICPKTPVLASIVNAIIQDVLPRRSADDMLDLAREEAENG